MTSLLSLQRRHKAAEAGAMTPLLSKQATRRPPRSEHWCADSFRANLPLPAYLPAHRRLICCVLCDILICLRTFVAPFEEGSGSSACFCRISLIARIGMARTFGAQIRIPVTIHGRIIPRHVMSISTSNPHYADQQSLADQVSFELVHACTRCSVAPIYTLRASARRMRSSRSDPCNQAPQLTFQLTSWLLFDGDETPKYQLLAGSAAQYQGMQSSSYIPTSSAQHQCVEPGG